MNPKIRKVRRDIERAERKIAELTAGLEKLKSDRLEMEDAEIARRVRAAAAEEGAEIDAVLDKLMPGRVGTSLTAAEKRGNEVNADEENDR